VTYWIGRSYWGKGIATDALTAFLAVDRSRPLQARVASDNVASRRVLEKPVVVREDWLRGDDAYLRR
jgi:RimJ/RimL family protein N-acetyltransferase